MTITFRASDNGASGALPNTVNKPTGTVEGDIIIISNVGDTETTPAAVSGFTEIYEVDYSGGDTIKQQCFYKVAGASEPSTYEITGGNTSSKQTIETYYDSVGGGTWSVSAAVTAQAANGVANNVGPITTVDDCMLLGQWGCDSQSTVSSAPSGMTNATSSISGVSVAMYTYYEAIATGGSDSRSFTYSADGSLGALLYLTYSGGASDTIDTIDDPTLDAESSLEATYTGFATDSIDDITVGGVDATSIVDDDAGTVTWTNPDVWSIANSGGGNTVPIPGTTPTFAFSNGTESANTTSDFDVKSGWAIVTFASINSSDPYYIKQLIDDQFSETVVDGNFCYYNTSGTTSIDATGRIITSASTVDIVIIQGTTALEAMTLNTESVVAPVMPADATPNRKESQTNMGTWPATSGASITYSHSGTDSADFTYNVSTALLTFTGSLLDPISTTYDITLTATNAGGSDSQDLTITVISDSTGDSVHKIARIGLATKGLVKTGV